MGIDSHGSQVTIPSCPTYFIFGIRSLEFEMTKVLQQAGVRLKNTHQPQHPGKT